MDEKEQLRVKLQKCVLAIPPEQRSEKSHQACQKLISTPEFQNASSIMMYLSLPHEVDTSEAILHAWQLGKAVSVPKISWQQRRMIAVEINSLETGLSTSASGLRSPVTGVPMTFEDISLVVTPALGFDRNGNRLGRGGSYYDRFFADEKFNAAKCGFSFAEQVVDSIPIDSTDVPVDFLVTDEEITYFNKQVGE
ncbi:MAG: 5-formyltetrahydrofolate cyclo-ligase [Phycisphaerae bacterium]|jgi:5-formyltetrahydrofolate cyclo-ligase